jgi:choline kinase
VHDPHVLQTVILAAGNGSRLGSPASGVPKPLVRVAGVPLIAHALRHASSAGCREAVIVLGRDGALVRAAVESLAPSIAVRFVENTAPASPNGVSLAAAAPVAAARFFLQMVDHLFARTVLARLVAAPFAPGEAGRVLIDPAPAPELDPDDATKVRMVDGRVVAIGKGIEPWDAVDAGCFVLTPAVFEAVRQVPAGEARTVSAAMRQLAARGVLGAADLGGVPWVDVDTPQDHEVAERLLAAAG